MRGWLTLAIALAGVAFSGSAPAGDETYYPYQFFEQYWQEETGAGAPPLPLPPPRGAAPATAPEPARRTRAPLFLFPAELGFGVAVGTAEDLCYLHESYYRFEGGVWYRSASYRGPWIRVPRGKLPPELSKRKLSELRALRDREFRTFWQEKGSYQGRLLRPESVREKPEVKRPN